MRAHVLALFLSAGFCTSGCVPDCAKAGTCPADTDEDGGEDTGGGSASFSVNPERIDFGILFIGDFAEQVLTIENTGDFPLGLELALTSEQKTAYALDLSNPAPNAGESTDLIVSLIPSVWGNHDAELSITDSVSGDSVIVPITAWVEADVDGDGFASIESGGTDCDDNDATVNPDATETWYDGVDQDCDGGSDYDQDGDGYDLTEEGGDCDDLDPTIYPGATEIPDDAVDSDCDGDYDDDVDDIDGDGFTVEEGDCVDTMAEINPAAIEICDGWDNNCDHVIDEGVTSTFYVDADEDGYGDAADTEEGCEAPFGYVAEPGDCDDGNSAYHPGAPETDCADLNDYNCDGSVGSADADADGWAACEECDDGDRDVNPDATEVCDSANTDEDCNGLIDDVDPDVDMSTASTWYGDSDGDGYGRADTSTDACDEPSGYVADKTDCDDDTGAINPGATEICDASDTDEDCDGLSDDADTSVDLSTGSTWYEDVDGDGYGDSATGFSACEGGIEGIVALGDDCDDSDSAYNPGAAEVCTDPADYNCDGSVGYADADLDGWAACEDCDDNDATVSPDGIEIEDDGIDQDCDGADATSVPVAVDDDGDGYTEDDGDCDDTDPGAYPGAIETCDGVDQNCDGTDDDTGRYWYTDSDRDGYGDIDVAIDAADCVGGAIITGVVAVSDDTDCDDTDSAINPEATEVSGDGIDQDCDGIKN